MMKALIPAILALATAVNCYGQDKWLNIYKEVDNVPRVVANPVANISNIQHQGLEQDKYDTMILTVDGEEIAIDMSQIEKCVIGHNIPTISIETDEYVDEIPSKEYYLTGKVSMAGYGNYDDLKSTAVNIKGRGNSTWYYDKKPYRLKFDKKISICGLTKAKNYVLLANYIDPTLMRNAVALKIAQLLGISYTNHCIPVNLILNGKYRGSYMLTEKVGLNSASVDVKDEAKAILFELDTNYDEAYKFKSPIYNLPVMVKDPDLDEIAEADETLTAQDLFEQWQADFNKFEASVKDGSYAEYIDLNSVADYLLVYLVARNLEVNHPKSVYLYKKNIEDKYTLGPVWDFDWAYSFSVSKKESANPKSPLLLESYAGADFFFDIVKTDQFKTVFAEHWTNFKNNIWPKVKDYMAEYHDMVEVSALQNGEVWPEDALLPYVASSENFEMHYQKLLDFLETRISWIDQDENFGLYSK